MSSRITCFTHSLRNDKSVLIVEPGQTISDALIPLFPKEKQGYLLVYQNGVKVTDLETPVLDDAFIVARIVPQGPVVGFIAIAVMAAVSIGSLIVTLDAVVYNVSSLFGNGFGLFGQEDSLGAQLNSLFNPEAKTSKQALSRPGITGGNNSFNANGKVPYILGTNRITPFYGAAPYTSIGGTDGVQQFIHFLYVVGYSTLAVSDLRFGTKPLATNAAGEDDGTIVVDGNFPAADAEVEIRQLGTIPALYDASGWTVKETAVSSDLSGFRNATSNADITGGELSGLTITITASDGPPKVRTITRSSGNWGTAGVRIGDIVTLIGMTNAGNNYPMVVTNVSGFTLTCYDATDMVSEGPHSGISATVAPGSILETAKRVRKLSWTIEFPRGLVKWNVNTPQNHSIPVKAYYRQKGGSDGSWIEAPAWTGEAGTTITRNKPITMRFTTITADLGTSYVGEYETRVVVEQPAANNDDTYTYFEGCTWSSVRTSHAVAPVSPKASDKVVMIAVKVRASYQLQDNIEEFNLMAVPVLTRTGAGADEAAIRALPNNPAASFIHACMDSINPRPRPASSMDFVTLKAWADSCTALGLECNTVVSSGIDMGTLLQQIASAGRAISFKKDMLYSVAHDAVKSADVAHITPRNAWDFSYTRTFETLPHGFKIPFINKEQDYESDERMVLGDGYIYDTENDSNLRDAFGAIHTTAEEYLPGQNYVEATEFEELSLFGVTSPAQVWKAGRYAWECRKYRNTVYSVNMDIEQLVTTLGDKARYSHPILSQALWSARITAINNDVDGDVVSVNIDAPVTLAATYGCRIRTPSTSIYRALSNTAGETMCLVFTTVIPAASSPSVGDLVMTGPAGNETEEVIVADIKLNDDYSATLSLIPYAQEVFDANDDTPADFYSRIIQTSRGVVRQALDSDEFAETIAAEQGNPTNISSAYADYLSGLLQAQVDRAITYYTQVADPSIDWTTDTLKNEHIGDFWRTAAGAVWQQWSGTAWNEISDPVAQQAADDAQTTADTKVTVWVDLTAAQASAEANDLFLASGLLYRCLTDLAATYERITPKRWPDGTTLPAAATHEPLLVGDTFYKTNDRQWYVYTTSWVADGEPQLVPADIPVYTPRHLGRIAYASLSGQSGNEGDSILSYSATIGECGIYKRVSGSWVDQTSPTTELIMLAWSDILWATANNYPSTGTASEKVQAYMGSGVNYFETLAANVAFITQLFSEYIKVGAAIYGGDRYNANGTDNVATAKGIWIGADGTVKAREIVLESSSIETKDVWAVDSGAYDVGRSSNPYMGGYIFARGYHPAIDLPGTTENAQGKSGLHDFADWYTWINGVFTGTGIGSNSYPYAVLIGTVQVTISDPSDTYDFHVTTAYKMTGSYRLYGCKSNGGYAYLDVASSNIADAMNGALSF